MVFLQPILLWGLPLILLPVLIHLLNRMRHRPQPWGAMRFLLAANRRSVSHARLRHLLVLAMRVLAVLLLILFLSRPLGGGWLGWGFTSAPDAIIVLFDRSCSMEALAQGGSETKRENALKLLAAALKPFEGRSHIIWLDSAERKAQEVRSAATVFNSDLAKATDTSADFPALFQMATKWLVENKAGASEIWIASDLQSTNWQLEDARWKEVIARLEARPQKVKIRLLALGTSDKLNTAVQVADITTSRATGQPELSLSLDFQRNSATSEVVPLQLRSEETRTQVDVRLASHSQLLRQKLPLSSKQEGWGIVELPADANVRDNQAFYLYGPAPETTVGLFCSEEKTELYIRAALATREAESLKEGSGLHGANWSKLGLLAWQQPLPNFEQAALLKPFLEQGGVVLFLPPAREDSSSWLGHAWGRLEKASNETWQVKRWSEEEGPLAKTDERLSLPLERLNFQQRQLPTGGQQVLAAFSDGSPFLTRSMVGRGQIYFLSTLPNRDWSSLADGQVWVPMIRRLEAAGQNRLKSNREFVAGEVPPSIETARWVSLDTPGKNIRYEAGIYSSDGRTISVNRSPVETDSTFLEPSQVSKLWQSFPSDTFFDGGQRSQTLQAELWRLFLVLMLIALIGEAWLALPLAKQRREEQV